MKLSLNFSTKRYKSPLFNRLMLALAIILIILPFAVNAYFIIYNSDRISRSEDTYRTGLLDSRDYEQKVRQADLYISEMNLPGLSQKTYFYYPAIVLVNFKWLRLLSSLELIIPDDVRIRKIYPNISQQSDSSRVNVSFNGISKDFESVLVFLKKLEESPLFDKVYLKSIKNRTRESIGYEYSFDVLYLQPVE